MKEQVLDVLLYLFEHCVVDDLDVEPDRDSLEEALAEAGFSHAKIQQAFVWLDGLNEQRPLLAQGAGIGSVRVYGAAELMRLDPDCRGFLQFLESAGVLDATQRELVIDRVMALADDEVELEDLKWVVLMVLFNQPGQEDAYAWMENLVLDHGDAFLH